MSSPCFLIPTSTTVIQPDQPIFSTSASAPPQAGYSVPTHLWLADQLTKLSPTRPALADDSLGPLELPTKTRVPSLQDKELKSRIIQDAIQAEKERKNTMMLKARGKFARTVYENTNSGRPQSAVFLAPERTTNRCSKLTINEPMPKSELHRPPSIEYVRSRVTSSKLDKHISECPEYQEALANWRQQKRSERKGPQAAKAGARTTTMKNIEDDLAKTAPHLLTNTRFKLQQKIVDSYVDSLSQTPLQRYKSIGAIKDNRPSSCFMSSERDRYVPSLAYRENKMEAELNAPRLMTEKQAGVRGNSSPSKDSPASAQPKSTQAQKSKAQSSILVPADAKKTPLESLTPPRGHSNERQNSTDLSAPDKFMKDMAAAEQEKARSNVVAKEPVSSHKTIGTWAIASRSISNHKYKSNERSISPWKEWRIKNSLSVRRPELVMDMHASDNDDRAWQKNANDGKAISAQKGRGAKIEKYSEIDAANARDAASEPHPATHPHIYKKTVGTRASATRYHSCAHSPSAADRGGEARSVESPRKGTANIKQDQPINRKVVAMLRQEHAKKLGAGRSPGNIVYSPSKHTQNMIARAKHSAFCLEDEEISTASVRGAMQTPRSSPQRIPPSSDPRRIAVLAGKGDRIKDRIPIHDKLKYKSSAYIPDYSKTSGRDQQPGYRHLCNVKPIEAPRSTSANARSATNDSKVVSNNLQYKDMHGLLYTPAGLPVPKSLMCMLSDNILNNIRDIPASAITADVDGANALLATCDNAEYNGPRRFSAKRPISVNDLKPSPGRNQVTMAQQSPRSRPISQSGMRYDTKRAAEPFQPVVDTFAFMPDAEATIEESNLERKRYDMVHPTIALASKMPVTGREVVPGKMVAYMLTNLSVPTSTMITKTGKTQDGTDLYKPVISTSHFDYKEQLNVRDAGAYIKPRVKVPRIMPDTVEGSTSDAGRLGLDMKISLLDSEYMQSSKFYDKTHIDDCFKSVASSPHFSLQTARKSALQ